MCISSFFSSLMEDCSPNYGCSPVSDWSLISTIDREIFDVKFFSLVALVANIKIFHVFNARIFLPRKMYMRKFPDLRY